jgi:predicted adenine nucleotide alpha hydrolase (AANH) superfamily ATPase
VLRTNPVFPGSARVPEIPTPLLESFRMVPVDFVEATSTLHIAFGEGIDYSVLYAIERMLDCHTQACLCSPGVLRQTLADIGEQRRQTETVFDRVADAVEFARIIRSYAAKVSASEIRMALCGSCIWVRLDRTAQKALNLIFRVVPDGAERFSESTFPTAIAPAS